MAAAVAADGNGRVEIATYESGNAAALPLALPATARFAYCGAYCGV
jgi:hypothetical protein